MEGAAKVEDYKVTLRRLALRDDRYIDGLLREEHASTVLSGLAPKEHALSRVASLIAVDAAPPSFMSAV
jgi:hypothetical protein